MPFAKMQKLRQHALAADERRWGDSRNTVLTVKVLAIWLAILICAVANGALREAILIPHLGRTSGLLLSGILLSVLILAISCLALPWLGVTRFPQLVGIGLGWLALTLVFEISFGLLQGKTWPVLLEAYTF